MNLAVRTFGSGPKRALLLHGVSSNADGWWRVGPALADLGYRVTAPDLRGHGATGAAPSYRLRDHADDVARLGARWEVVLGHSMGGAIALLLAEPQFCDRLILEDPALVVPASPETLDWFTAPYRSSITAEAVAAANPAWHPEDARIKAEALLQSSRAMVEQTLSDNPDWNLMARILELEVPTLLVGADPEHGGLVPESLGESIAEQVPSLEYLMIEAGSHSIHRDEFQALMAAIGEWLSDG